MFIAPRMIRGSTRSGEVANAREKKEGEVRCAIYEVLRKEWEMATGDLRDRIRRKTSKPTAKRFHAGDR